ncbi:MAG: TrbC/VirB2 family protein [Candidatus Pacebacteria bacterium]|nr:TrbC/VirB2 family protein [Candidatus Paceibacterota bacterium]
MQYRTAKLSGPILNFGSVVFTTIAILITVFCLYLPFQTNAQTTGDTTVVVTPQDTYAKFEMMLPVDYKSHIAYIDFGLDPKNLRGRGIAVDTGTVFILNLWDVRPNTTYYYQVVADDKEQTELTEVRSFKSGSGATVGVYIKGFVSSVNASAISQTTARITGQMIKKGPRVEVLVDINNNGKYEYKTMPLIDGNGIFTFTLVDLKPAHIYSYVVTKVGDATTQYTLRKSFLTLPVAVVPYLEIVTDTSVIIAAKFTDGVQEPAVRYGVDADHLSEPVLMKEDGAEKLWRAEIKDLAPDTAYVYKLEGYNGGAKVDYTGMISFLTARKKETPAEVSQISGGGTVVPESQYKDTGIVQCGNYKNGGLVQVVDPNKLGIDGKPVAIGQQSCGFYQLMQLIQRVIDFLIFLVAPIVATVIILWAGVLILTSGGSTEKVGQAKSMFTKAVIGLLIAMGAWIIVKFILVTLGYNESIFASFY